MTVSTVALPLQRRYVPSAPLDLGATLGPHVRGPYDPCHRVVGGVHWRTWRTPIGPATLRLAADSAGGWVDAVAWGAGAEWALDGVPALLGDADDAGGFEAPSGRLHDVHRRLAGMRLSRSSRVFEALVPAILEQLVTSIEAWRCWNRLLTAFGEPAPGVGARAPGTGVSGTGVPEGMRVLPSPSTLLEIRDWEWHQLGLDGRRRHTLIGAARVAGRLDEAAGLDVDSAVRRLTSLPGIGLWTAAEVVQRSHGAADVVSVGDYHLPNTVGFVFTGAPRTSDEQMLALLEPYRPHRQRVVRLVEACGLRAPRYGPRMPLRDNRRM